MPTNNPLERFDAARRAADETIARLDRERQAAHQARVDARAQADREWLLERDQQSARADAAAIAEAEGVDLVQLGAEVRQARARIERADSFGEQANPADKSLIDRFDRLVEVRRRTPTTGQTQARKDGSAEPAGRFDTIRADACAGTRCACHGSCTHDPAKCQGLGRTQAIAAEHARRQDSGAGGRVIRTADGGQLL